MTKDQLDAIRARANAATRGPWGYIGGTPDERDFDDLMIQSSQEVYVANVGGGWKKPDEGILFDVHIKDAEFVAHAREDVPALLAEVDDLRAALTKIRTDSLCCSESGTTETGCLKWNMPIPCHFCIADAALRGKT